MSYQKEIVLYQFQELFYKHFGKNIEKIDQLKADASDRKIYRLIAGYNSCIAVWNENVAENKAFIGFSKGFKQGGLNVPEIYRESDDIKFYLLEDLGDTTLFMAKDNFKINSSSFIFYCQLALKYLKEFQYKGLHYIDINLCYETKEFDLEQMKADEKKFSSYYLANFDEPSKYDKLLTPAFDYINSKLITTDKNFFMFRDFQPRNIMLKNEDLYFIDYQSGRKGPIYYDLASFLYSGSIELTEEEREFLIKSYLNNIKYKTNKQEFAEMFKFFVLIRLIQVLGSYGYSYLQKKEKKYIEKIDKAIVNMKSLLGQFDDKIIDEFIYKLSER